MAIPYKELKKDNKKKQVAMMFNNIAAHYDFLNHFLSAGIDRIWRKRAISLLKNRPHNTILDIATGTGDFALEALKINPERVTGIDISSEMLNVGKKKIENKNLNHLIELMEGDAENLQFSDDSFDAITVGFGVRNFENLEKGLKEMNRVLASNGTAIVLEFSKAKKFPVKQLFNLYFNHILPAIGRFFSKDKSAYSYLPESVNEFPDGDSFIKILEKCGYKNCRQISLAFGIASIYYCEK